MLKLVGGNIGAGYWWDGGAIVGTEFHGYVGVKGWMLEFVGGVVGL